MTYFFTSGDDAFSCTDDLIHRESWVSTISGVPESLVAARDCSTILVISRWASPHPPLSKPGGPYNVRGLRRELCWDTSAHGHSRVWAQKLGLSHETIQSSVTHLGETIHSHSCVCKTLTASGSGVGLFSSSLMVTYPASTEN